MMDRKFLAHADFASHAYCLSSSGGLFRSKNPACMTLVAASLEISANKMWMYKTMLLEISVKVLSEMQSLSEKFHVLLVYHTPFIQTTFIAHY